VIFPNQLFKRHPCLRENRAVYLVEEPRFFRDDESRIWLHKNKLVLHRASMRAYADGLRKQGYVVQYIPFQRIASGNLLFDVLREHGVRVVNMVNPVDHVLMTRMVENASHEGIDLITTESPAFLTSEAWLRDFFGSAPHYSMASFYIALRKRLRVMVRDGKPEGGKWSFDPANRKRLPKNLQIPMISFPKINTYVEEATAYVNRLFPDHPGRTAGFCYPVTHGHAEKWFRQFLDERLRYFGDYQDAILADESFLFHSVLTPALNIGLLTPTQIVDETLAFAKSQGGQIPINALEGFIRQVIGWREFMRAVYALKGETERSSNFWQHKRPLPPSFYSATTGVLPVDTAIRRLHDKAYVHHIERLMVLGNFMLLCEIDPNEVYRWFMEMFIDSYDWVMVPNLYGMSQYADGGMITTKPYISSSNYILKMSNFPRGAWCDIWDALYWRFIHKHRDFFAKNPRLRVMTAYVERMGKERLGKHLYRADKFLDQLDSSRPVT
jgi:deoxyribodipyrimidine photolyase-related protein